MHLLWPLPALPPAVKAFDGNLLFEQLSMPAKQAIIRSMTPQVVRAGDVIITQVGGRLTGWLGAGGGACLPCLPAHRACQQRPGAAAAHRIPPQRLRLHQPGGRQLLLKPSQTPHCTLHPAACPLLRAACRRVTPTPPSSTCWSGGRLTCTCSRRSGGRSARCTHTSQAGKWAGRVQGGGSPVRLGRDLGCACHTSLLAEPCLPSMSGTRPALTRPARPLPPCPFLGAAALASWRCCTLPHAPPLSRPLPTASCG